MSEIEDLRVERLPEQADKMNHHKKLFKVIILGDTGKSSPPSISSMANESLSIVLSQLEMTIDWLRFPALINKLSVRVITRCGQVLHSQQTHERQVWYRAPRDSGRRLRLLLSQGGRHATEAINLGYGRPRVFQIHHQNLLQSRTRRFSVLLNQQKGDLWQLKQLATRSTRAVLPRRYDFPGRQQAGSRVREGGVTRRSSEVLARKWHQVLHGVVS